MSSVISIAIQAGLASASASIAITSSRNLGSSSWRELYTSLRRDIVIMDMVMPELSDVDAVRQIRALDRSARIVMCSAMGQQQLVTDALETGASGFITKPFTASRVLEALADLVGGAAV
jgi:DNA-binding NarL/FixJ family response regulator